MHSRQIMYIYTEKRNQFYNREKSEIENLLTLWLEIDLPGNSTVIKFLLVGPSSC